MDRRHRLSAACAIWLSSAFAAAIVSACAAPIASWGGDGIHAVDGYWILAERPCDTLTDLCVEEMQAAEAAIGVDPGTVVRQATAGLPQWRSVGPLGQVSIRLDNRSGLANFVVLDLADGSRRVIGIGCPGVQHGDGAPRCWALPFDDYRVGATPSF